MQAVTTATETGNRILDSLAEDERRRILNAAKIVRVASEEPIYDFGDTVNFVYFPADAVFSTASLMEDGSSAEINLTGWEGATGVFSAFNEQPARYWTNVLICGAALKIEISALRQFLIDSDALSNALLESYRSLMRQISQRAVCNGRHSLAERFCFWLTLVHDRVKTPEIPLTHETIAKKLGARRAGITNVAGTLQAEGVISYSRGAITILDRAALEKLSCECAASICDD